MPAWGFLKGPMRRTSRLKRSLEMLSECVKKTARPSTKLRANGNYIDNIDNLPFVLRLSKHERIFSHTLSTC
jgi:hypothetical protein